jgi:aspartate/methionine/tyrosine aminotransferase
MRFSNRLPPAFATNALTRLLESLRSASAPILDLTISNPTECGFDYPQESIIAALANSKVLGYQPDPKGLESARAAIAEMHGCCIEPRNIQLVASTSEAYSMLFKLLADPGDNVIAPSPCYPLFEWLARFEGIECKFAPMILQSGWQMDIEAIEGACNANTRAIIAVNPNNPTGQYITEAEWSSLTELANKKGLAIIVDEVFSRFPIEPQKGAMHTAVEGTAPYCPVFVLSGLSKAAILPQLKLGWITMLGQATKASEALAFIADQYLSVSAPIALAAPQLVAMAPELQKQVLSRLRKNLGVLDMHLKKRPHLSRLPVHGGWNVLIQRPDIEDDGKCALRLLSDHRVLVHPGHFFDIQKNGFLVASLLPEPAIFEKAVAALVEGLEQSG